MHRKHLLDINISLQSLYRYVLIFISAFCFLCEYCKAQSAFYNLGESYAKEGNYKEAIRLTKMSLSSDEANPDKFFLLLDYCAICNYFANDAEKDSCTFYANKALALSDKVEGIDSDAILSNISHSFLKAGLYTRAVEARLKIRDSYAEKYGEESVQMINQLRLLSDFYLQSGDKTNALKFAKLEEELSFKLREEVTDFESRIFYSESLQYLRYVIQECESASLGVPYLLDVLNNHRDAIDQDSRKHTLNTIWAISRDNNFIEGCLAVYKEETLYGSPQAQFTNLINLVQEDPNIKNDTHASEYAQGLYEIIMSGQTSDFFSDDEIERLYALMTDYYSTIGEVRKSYDMAKINYEWRNEHQLDTTFCDIRVLISGSSLESEAQNIIKLGKEILESCRYNDDKEALQFIYENLAGAYFRIGDLENGEYYINLISGTDEFSTLYSKAGAFLQVGDMKKLLPISQKLVEFENVSDMNQANSFLMLMVSARDARDKNTMEKYSEQYVSLYRSNLLKEIPLMSEEEQAKFLKSYPLSNILSYDFFIGLKNDVIEWQDSRAAYDYTLLKKGILLSSQNNFRNAIKDSSDSIIVKKWERLLALDQNSTFSVEKEILKRDLIKYASSQSDYTDQLRTTWQDVQNALQDDEIAIEYIQCYNFEDFTDKECHPVYIALAIKKGIEEPIVIPCEYSAVINSIISENNVLDEHNTSLYQTLWQPLLPYLQGVKKIYFSPTERLNSIAMEYADSPEGRVCDRWDIKRLSSTRELLRRERPFHATNVILYGGLDYDLGRNELIAESHQGSFHNTHASRSEVLGINRYGVEFLPGTIAEVNEIAKNFDKKTIRCRIITGKEGTEESFKDIMGQYVDIIHLATHGFFWSPEIAEKRNYVSFLQGEIIDSSEENAMSRSGLFFTGANIGLMGEELPEDVEDGVLTAKELSNMNLGNVELVVMSACESGLGEISGEGVFGLQRGFKLAGANTLMMSLWKVDDEATKVLMTEFYRYLLDGKSKAESLRLAQKHVKSQPGWEAPKYWAGFILLDAMD